MKFVNCTPHEITIHTAKEVCAACDHIGGYCGNCSGAHWGMQPVLVLPPSGIMPRCATVRKETAPIAGVRIITQTMGDVVGLPPAEDGVALIVSAMVLSALNGTRPDVFAPDTGADAVRENGQIVAVRGLVQ